MNDYKLKKNASYMYVYHIRIFLGIAVDKYVIINIKLQ